MTIAILDRSEPAALRLGSLVSGIKGVKNVIQIIDRQHSIESLNTFKADILLYDISTYGDQGMLCLKKIRESLPDTLIIALASSSVELYRKKCIEIGIRYCLDKNSEYNRIPKIIAKHSVKHQRIIKSHK